MNWVKKISKILIGLFVIVNFTISFDYNPISETNPRIVYTELFVSKEDVITKVVRFDTAQQLLLFLNSKKNNIGKVDWDSRIPKVDSKNLLDFKIQNLTSKEFKPLLLNIVLNDIIQQKSHWI